MKETLKDLDIKLDLTNDALFMEHVLFITQGATNYTLPWEKIIPKTTMRFILTSEEPKKNIKSRINMYMLNKLHGDIIEVALKDNNSKTCELDELYLTEGCVMLHSNVYTSLKDKCIFKYNTTKNVTFPYLDLCRVIVDDKVPKDKAILFTKGNIGLETVEVDVDVTDEEIKLKSAFKFTLIDNVVITLEEK